jgi:hypothetical protein
MDEVSNLKQVLVQTQSVERMQEAARRQGDADQKQIGRLLVDRVEIEGRQVEESPMPDAVQNDPEKKSGSEEQAQESPEGERVEESADESPDKPAQEPPLDEDKGTAIDVRA